uniref:Uncharacterized protein n=1 Tax=Ditylenchus dipsaci TaxID=166011 RepID=A0A915EER7_9BILA
MGRMRGGRGGPAGGMVRPRNVGRSVGSTLAGVAGAAATLSAIHNAKQQQQQHSYQTPIVIEDNSNESAEDASGQEESGPEERPKEGWLQPPTSHQEGP